ncbi:MAG TPA: hypothetical protein VFQ44_11005 [Streptosporangiaceae bacterium]|nr:hypothetical protein [Streptosporangiaceae bacterium]
MADVMDPHGRGEAPVPILAGGVVGEVSKITQGTIQHDKGSTFVSTFRLQRHDPPPGHAGSVTVQLTGSRAIGFAAEGDWVEVLGTANREFINVRRAINRTSGAEYQNPESGFTSGVQLAVEVLVIGFIFTMGILSIFGG